MKKITKAVIPAAGLGTRMLPQAKGVPKEMLPIVDKPSVQYLVEEAAQAGITDVLIITNRDKDCMEDYFDYSPEYEKKLSDSGKTEMLGEIRRAADLANVYFLRQKETRGLGHAVARTRSFVGDEPFLVLYGDDVIDAPFSIGKQKFQSVIRFRCHFRNPKDRLFAVENVILQVIVIIGSHRQMPSLALTATA